MDEKKKKMIQTAVAAGVALLLAFVSLWFSIIGPALKERAEQAEEESASEETAAVTTDATTSPTNTTAPGYGGYPAPGYLGPPGADAGIPGVPGTTGTTGTTEAKAEKNLPPLEKSRKDPFAPLIPPPPSPPEWRVLSASLPPITIARPGERVTREETTEQPMPEMGAEIPRRVVGVVTGKRAYAILEQEGQTTIVRPGDVLPDLARVERIEPNRVLLRKNGRPIWVPLQASSEMATTGGYTPPTGGYPYGPGARPYGAPPIPPGYPRPGSGG